MAGQRLKAHAIRVFNDHVETVQRTVPPERLLVFDVRQGWAPLCAFLGISDVPEAPFPHVNEGAILKAKLRNVRLALAGGYILLAALLAWGIGALVIWQEVETR